MKRPEKLARQIQKKYRFDIPTLDNLVFLVGQQGYELVDFDPESDSFIELCHELGSDKAISTAFVCTGEDARMLFVRSSLSAEEQRIVLAHELGHIVCQHQANHTSVEEEYEADEFAHYLLNPSPWLRLQNQLVRRKWAVLAVIAALSVLAWGANALYHSRYSNYYVSENGTKYHLRECLIIHDRVGLRRLTWDEAGSEIYEPCNVCLKNK